MVPRALAIGVAIITPIYIMTSAVFLYLVPLERVTSGATFAAQAGEALFGRAGGQVFAGIDRKSTRLNSSHSQISYAVFCLKKKKKNITITRCVPHVRQGHRWLRLWEPGITRYY